MQLIYNYAHAPIITFIKKNTQYKLVSVFHVIYDL